MSVTVRDLIDRETENGMADAAEALHVLGIDPDMSVDLWRVAIAHTRSYAGNERWIGAQMGSQGVDPGTSPK